MVLAGEGHADQAPFGGGQQKAADGAVDDGVGDIQQPVAARRVLQTGVQPGQGSGVGGGAVEEREERGGGSEVRGAGGVGGVARAGGA